LNIVFLSFASLVPFWTAFNNENIDDPEAVAYYGVGMIMTNLSLLAIWLYATWNHRLVPKDLERRTMMSMVTIILVGTIIVAICSLGNVYLEGLGYGLFLGAVWFIYMTARGHKTMHIEK
jgi:uncharacterized membrane protein